VISGAMTGEQGHSGEQLSSFYERAYTREPSEAERYGRWRALGAIGKADHVIALCARAGLDPQSTLDVGCGDGALLCELHRRSFGGTLAGVEITEAAAALSRARPQIESVTVFDGTRLPFADTAYELGLLSHVLEHVPDPVSLLAEVARACHAVLVEVPFEENLSARRAGKRSGAAVVGHLQRLDRGSMREIVRRAGMRVAFELDDPLPLSVHLFHAQTPFARIRAAAKWALRRALHGVAPALARRLFTLHYACLCLPVHRDDSPRAI
jgi:SAM-dependent methyltransferase